MQQRLCGREQEFGISINPSEKIVKEILDSILNVAPGFCVRSPQQYHPSHPYPIFFEGGMPPAPAVWLKNGSKAYIDQGLLELASAECVAGSLDLVTQEKANEAILNRALKLVRRNKQLKHLTLYKNNVGLRIPDSTQASYRQRGNPVGNLGVVDLEDEVSYGSHHNYSYFLPKRDQVLATLSNFIPVALWLTGNGHILRASPAKRIFGFSQRARHINKITGQEIPVEIHSRAIIDIGRQENLSGKAAHLGRLHLISRDATRCEFQTWLADAVTHLVLRLAEEGWSLPPQYRLTNAILELQNLNASIDFDYRVITMSGPVNIIKYNQIFLKAAKQLKPLSDMERKCLREWERVLDLLKARELRQLVGELDWVTKWYLLVNSMAKGGFNLGNVRAWAISMNYHDISSSPSKSGFARLDESGKIRHLVSPTDIRRFISSPPNTRAQNRSYLISRCLRDADFAKKLVYLDWDRACIRGSVEKVIYFGDEVNPILPQRNFKALI